jgi:hypothetical protein
MKCILVLFVAILAFNVVFVGSVYAAAGDGISSYNPIPQTSPSPTFDPNATATPTPLPSSSPNSTVIYVGADRVQSINPNGQPISLSTYNHTTVYLTYAEADSYGVNFTGASNRYHNEQQSTTQMSVVIDGIGSYHFTFTVLYNQVTDQPVTLRVVSGDGTANVLPITSVNRGFTLDVVINTKVLPQFPSASEIADAQYGMQRKMLEDVTSGQEETNRFNQMVIGVVVVAVVVIGILLVLVLRHQRHTDYEINNQNARGYGRGRM